MKLKLTNELTVKSLKIDFFDKSTLPVLTVHCDLEISGYCSPHPATFVVSFPLPEELHGRIKEVLERYGVEAMLDTERRIYKE